MVHFKTKTICTHSAVTLNVLLLGHCMQYPSSCAPVKPVCLPAHKLYKTKTQDISILIFIVLLQVRQSQA